jgi:flagellar biosynthesis component FlhA
MFFILLLGLSALLVAGSAAYFSVLGIATLFSGSYYQVIVMAGALEFGKLVATSYLYRYWSKTVWWLKGYLIVAVLVMMGITSMGIFGYLSAAYQVNSTKFAHIDSQIALIESQKTLANQELEQTNKRIETLNDVRIAQEQRVQAAGNYKAPREQAYAAIEKANEEVKQLTDRIKGIQQEQFKKDEQILLLKQDINKAKDIGTFKFVSQSINKPLDTVVTTFILILICVFDPLAVSLVLAFNVATRGSVLKEEKKEAFEEEEDSKTLSESTKEHEKYQNKIKFSGVTAKGSIKK